MGPLAGITVIELAGIGPGPFAAMMLSDMGANVIRIDRARGDEPGVHVPYRMNVMNRGRRSVAVNLKSPAGVETVLKLIEKADALIEGFRPGVTERLGLGPEPCLQRNPRLVYGRMTGYGQDGPMATVAGHDIDYIALSGMLSMIGERDRKPVAPLNLVGDFGGGGMFLAFGVVCGILEARGSGRGQIVDAAMVEGAAMLGNIFQSFRAQNQLSPRRGDNILDGGAHFYDTYETKDGGYMAIGAIEAPFYKKLLELMGLNQAEFEPQMDKTRWPEWKRRFAEVFKTKTREEWTKLMVHEDACAMPVLSLDEAAAHPHNKARKAFVEFAGVEQAAPAPRFSRTVPELKQPPAEPGEHSDAVLAEFGFSAADIAKLREQGALI
ncbi:MAG TPA: CaiB/BaiF CoA-transferase family protein [Gammaproteobacteria bacterium]|nr:CaiB/BaiF CoA-transferase family protein [Gammaproteobacteria bacterium]